MPDVELNPKSIIDTLEQNKSAFTSLLSGFHPNEYLWKPKADKWCLLEVVCHLLDEEREDFRARTRHVLNSPLKKLPSIDPAAWVETRKYMEQDYITVLKMFLDERENSVRWLRSLENPQWNNYYAHPRFGPMSAVLFLNSWLAHDYFHMRQIIRIKYNYLEKYSTESLRYAGEW